MAAGWGQILAAGVNGYLKGQQIVASRDEADADKAWRDETRTRQRSEWAEKDGLKADLRSAAAPVEVVEGAGGAVLPATMDNRDVGQPGEAPVDTSAGAYRVGAQTMADPVQAKTLAAQQNSPEAVAGRQAAAYQKRGMPTEAAALESRQASLLKQAQEMKEKGLFEGLRKFRSGDMQGTLGALKASGMFSPTGDVQMEPVETEIPGVGKVKSFNLTFQNKGQDGTATPVTLNSHDLSMQSMPYEKQLELSRKGVESESKADARIASQTTRDALAAATVALRSSQTTLADARASRVGSGGGGGGGGGSEKADRETRLRLQSMTGNVSREIREIDSAIKTEKAEGLPNKPSPRLQELVSQRAALTEHRTTLNQEMEALPRSTAKAGAGAPKAPKMVKTKYGEALQVNTAEEYAKLKSGDLYIRPGGDPTNPLKKK